MDERVDEAKGNIKQGVGKATGDTKMEAEGRVESETAKGKRELKGIANKLKGSIEQGLGKVTGDDETRARGTADRMEGDTDRAG
jgi:uncharacterized protein YjbJ (UPF0337 family)